MRIDRYLKLSRVVKRRTIANELCDNDRVYVNGKVVKAHYEVKISDEINIHYGDKIISHIVSVIPYDAKNKQKKDN